MSMRLSIKNVIARLSSRVIPSVKGVILSAFKNVIPRRNTVIPRLILMSSHGSFSCHPTA